MNTLTGNTFKKGMRRRMKPLSLERVLQLLLTWKKGKIPPNQPFQQKAVCQAHCNQCKPKKRLILKCVILTRRKDT